MTYKILVEFSREEYDDTGVIGLDSPTPQDFVKQFCLELQGAYEDLAMAGHFQVKSITIDDVTTEIK